MDCPNRKRANREPFEALAVQIASELMAQNMLDVLVIEAARVIAAALAASAEPPSLAKFDYPASQPEQPASTPAPKHRKIPVISGPTQQVIGEACAPDCFCRRPAQPAPPRFVVEGFNGGSYAGIYDRKHEIDVSEYTEHKFTRGQLERIAEELNAKYGQDCK